MTFRTVVNNSEDAFRHARSAFRGGDSQKAGEHPRTLPYQPTIRLFHRPFAVDDREATRAAARPSDPSQFLSCLRREVVVSDYTGAVELSSLYFGPQVKKIGNETEGEHNRCGNKCRFHSFNPYIR
jgi:hypothetical protein